MNETDREMAEILGPEILERTRKIKENALPRPTREQLMSSALGIGENDPLEGYPPHVKDLLGEFVSVSKIQPTGGKKAFWIQTANEWREMGIKPSDISEMHRYATENYGEVTRPTAITSAYHMMKTERRNSSKGLRIAD